MDSSPLSFVLVLFLSGNEARIGKDVDNVPTPPKGRHGSGAPELPNWASEVSS
jgi:hypothetical protein